MLVLGVDQSTTNLGAGLVRYSGSKDDTKVEYVTHRFIHRPKGLEYPQTLFYIVNELRNLLTELKPDYVALEAPKDNRGFKATQILTELLGAIKYSLIAAKYGFVEIPPSTMKKIITGHGWSTKEEVAIAVAKKLQVPFESIVPAIYYTSGQKVGQVRKYILDGSDALGLALAFVPYLRMPGKKMDYLP